MKIAITGATGFVGGALCNYFHKKGHEILAIGNQDHPGEKLQRIATYRSEDITRAVAPIDADVCIHAAALSSEADSYKNLILNNVEGTLNVVAASKGCRFFIHISSSAVYQYSDRPVKENDATLNSDITDYGETKLLAEDIVEMDIPEHQKRVIFRPRAIYGIGDRILIPKILKLVKGPFFFCPFKRNVKGSLTHVDNIAQGIQLYLDKSDQPDFEIYNITDENPYDIRQLAINCASVLTRKKILAIPLPGFLMKRFFNNRDRSDIAENVARPIFGIGKNIVLDISKIRRELNYQPARNFSNSCAEIADWLDSFGTPQLYLQQVQQRPWSIDF